MLVRCGACQERMLVEDDAFGQLVSCPTCGTAVRVPAAPRPAAVPPPLPQQPAPVYVQPVQPVQQVQPVQPVQPAGITSRAVQPMRGGALVHRCPRCGSDVEHGNTLCPRCGVNVKRYKRRRR